MSWPALGGLGPFDSPTFIAVVGGFHVREYNKF